MDDLGPNVDDLSTANTEDSLLGSRKSTETISTAIAKEEETLCCHIDQKTKTKCCCCCGPSCTLITGAILTICGICSIIWTPFSILMNERLKMSPPFPPYQWWKNPPDEVLLRVYLFNITNPAEFLNGTDARLALQEVGPIIFREKLEHLNVTFNDNGTLSYVARRTAVFLPEMNSVDLNATLFVPNLAVLGMASYLWDATFFTKFLFNVLTRNLGSEAIVRISVDDYLWNNSDPILEVARNIAPSMVPVSNMGILSRIYSDFQDSVTVYIGPEYGHERFFLIDKYDGTEGLPGHGSGCTDSVVNSTEGVAYAQFLTKDSVLRYWRKTLCRVTPLFYDVEVEKYGVTAYKFALPNNTYDRTKPGDCYASNPALANGLSDVSRCFYDYPMAASFPHFLYGDDVLKTYVDGLEPKKAAHESFVIVEPLTGIPMESRARSQSNLVIKNLSGFSNKFHKFSNTIVPMFWAEYNQVGLPLYISTLMYFTVQVVRPFQSYFSALLILTGAIATLLGAKKMRRSHLAENKALRFEQELFFAKERC